MPITMLSMKYTIKSKENIPAENMAHPGVG